MTSLLRLVTGLPALRLRAHAELNPVRADDTLHTVTIGPYGEAIALWSVAATGTSAGSEVDPAWASMPSASTDRPATARVTVHWPDPTMVVNLDGVDPRPSLLQPLPSGRTLVVSARCAWRPSGPDRNARVFDADGALVAETTVGDGISHLLTTPTGDVWVGYDDTGVFGGYGWGGPGPQPIGHSGVVRFSPDLGPTWRYPSRLDPPGDESPPFGACRALNVTGQAVWVSSFPEFPVAQIANDVVRVWRNSVGGVRAILVDGARCALVGGYGAGRDRVVVGAVADDFVPRWESVLVLPDDQPLPADARLVARGHVLNVFAGRRWFKVDTELLFS